MGGSIGGGLIFFLITEFGMYPVKYKTMMNNVTQYVEKSVFLHIYRQYSSTRSDCANTQSDLRATFSQPIGK